MGLHFMIRRICVVRLADKVSTDVLQDKVDVIVKMKDMILQSCLRWYGHVIH